MNYTYKTNKVIKTFDNLGVIESFIKRSLYIDSNEKNINLMNELKNLYDEKGYWIKCKNCSCYFNFFGINNSGNIERKINNFKNNNCGCNKVYL